MAIEWLEQALERAEQPEVVEDIYTRLVKAYLVMADESQDEGESVYCLLKAQLYAAGARQNSRYVDNAAKAVRSLLSHTPERARTVLWGISERPTG